MSRTYRRRGQCHEYRWVLREWHWCGGTLAPHQIDPRSKTGRRAIARFHSDCRTHAEQRIPALVPARLRSPLAHAEFQRVSPLAQGPGLRAGPASTAPPQREVDLVVIEEARDMARF